MKAKEKQKEQIFESGYVIIDTQNKFIVGNTFRSNRTRAWREVEGANWTREKLKKNGYRCVKATITTEAV